MVQLPAGARDFFKNAQSGSRMHSAYCSRGGKESFSEAKRPGREVDNSPSEYNARSHDRKIDNSV